MSLPLGYYPIFMGEDGKLLTIGMDADHVIDYHDMLELMNSIITN
jgi:hypothetical protein